LENETLLPVRTRLPPYRPRRARLSGCGCVEKDEENKNNDEGKEDKLERGDKVVPVKVERSICRVFEAKDMFFFPFFILFFICSLWVDKYVTQSFFTSSNH
jgi:hypothetical protein